MSERIEKLFTVKEAAAELRVAAITVHRAIAQRKLGCFRFGRRVVIGEFHIEAFKRNAERPAKGTGQMHQNSEAQRTH